jgi:uncharacterized membrane protein YagU involved in acid resistance
MSRLKRVNAGDAAVDGLLAGLVAGLVKGLFLVLAGVLAGGAWRDVLIQLDPQGSSVLRGLLAHFAVAGIYGTIFGVVASRFRRVRPGWLAGLVYSLFVLLFAWFVLLPVAAPALREVGVMTWAIGHMIYGLLLGTLAASSESAGSRLSSR